MSNIKDNFQTKDDLNYDQLYSRLMNIANNKGIDKKDKTYSVKEKGKGKGKATPKGNKECT